MSTITIDPSLYSHQQNGYIKFDLEKMNTQQLDSVTNTTNTEAKKERIKAVAIATFSLLAAVAISGGALAITNATSALFGALLRDTVRNTADLFTHSWWWWYMPAIRIPEAVEKVFSFGSLGLTLMGAATGASISMLASSAFKNAQWHWNYANSLDKQSMDAQLQKGKLAIAN